MIIDEIIDNFLLLEEWDDRYRYVIELGRGLKPLDERDRNEANKVQGCASQVWLATTVRPNGQDGPVLAFAGDSDAHIVRGLIAILFAIYSNKHARDILTTDAIEVFNRIGLREPGAEGARGGRNRRDAPGAGRARRRRSPLGGGDRLRTDLGDRHRPRLDA